MSLPPFVCPPVPAQSRPGLPLHPTLSVSYSALAQWSTCERAWWLAHVGAWQGWPGGRAALGPDGAPTQAAIAYRGKQLVSPEQALGIVVHELAADVVRAVRDARRPPTHAWLRSRLRDRLKAVWTRSRAAFDAQPTERMLLDHYYGRPVAPDVGERVGLKAAAAMRRLLESDALADLREAARGEILCADTLDSVPFAAANDGPPALPTVPLFAAPDVVLVSATRSVSVDGVRFAPPVPQLIDWKCAARTRDLAVRRQLAIYTLYARARVGLLPHPKAGDVGRVVDLSPRGAPDALYLIGERDVAAAHAWLRAGLADIAGRPTDATGIISKAATRLAADRARCAACGLLEACRMDAADWAATPSHVPVGRARLASRAAWYHGSMVVRYRGADCRRLRSR